MKDRLISLLGATVAFYILFRLLFPDIGTPQKQLSYPTSINQGKYGLAGLDAWLKRDRLASYSLRRRYDMLGRIQQLPKRGNLIIISLPLRLEAQAQELAALKQWIKNGNNVLLMVAMSDWPEWASRSMSHSVSKELENLGLEMVSDKHKSSASKPAPQTTGDMKFSPFGGARPVEKTRYLVPVTSHPLTAGINKIQTEWLTSEGIRWHLDSMHGDRGMLVLLRDQTNQEPAFWLGFLGKGRILVSRHSDLFSNVRLGSSDNAVLFGNITQYMLGDHGKIVFDDMHQGLSVLYDAHAFFHDQRLHHTLLFMLAFWLIYILGHTNRFGQLHERKPVLQLLEHVQAVGNLFARRLHSSAVAIRYATHFFNEVRASYGLAQNGMPVWDELRQNTAIDVSLLRRAQSLYSKALENQQVNLITFINILKTMRRELK